MIGAIAGDVIGSVYEARPVKTKDFPLWHPRCRFTDDTVMTVAVARAVMGDRDYRRAMLEAGRAHPHAGYGGAFRRWLAAEDPRPYRSWGNGSAMRVSPVGFAFDDVGAVLKEAAATAAVTHDHPEGVKGAQAVALAVFLARTARDKDLIRREITGRFGYDLGFTLEAVRPTYAFDVSCMGSVPQAIVAFLESTSFEDAVRNAVSLGGDSDTLACMAGALAEAYFGEVPPDIRTRVTALLTPDLRRTTLDFCRRFGLEIPLPEEP